MTILIADFSRVLAAAPRQYLLPAEDTVNIALANNNNGSAVTVTVTVTDAHSQSDPVTITLAPYVAEFLQGVRMKGLLVSGNGANISIVITTRDEHIRLEPISFIAAAPASVSQGPRGITIWTVQDLPAALPTTFSGLVVAPGIAAVIADTLAFPLPVFIEGSYDLDIFLACLEPAVAGHGMIVEHRNAANGATLFNLGGCSAGDSQVIRIRRYAVAQNERIRVIAGGVAGVAGSQYIATIRRSPSNV